VRVAVVGHMEWVEFVRGDHVPAAGEIVHATDSFEEPAGGGAVAAVQLARMAGSATLITALGDDEVAERSRRGLAELGVQVEAATREEPTRRALTILDRHGERTIITIGDRLEPRGDDPVGGPGGRPVGDLRWTGRSLVSRRATGPDRGRLRVRRHLRRGADLRAGRRRGR
jgi:ribokinase